MNSAGDHFTTDTATATGHHRRRLTALAAGVTATLVLGGLSVLSAQDADAATHGVDATAETSPVGFGADTPADRDHDKDYYDGLLDIDHGSDEITVSWNRFTDHFKDSLVGHSDKNAGEDTGHLKVTYHHNWFSNVYSRIPSLRFGAGHFYDNYLQEAETGAHSRMGAQMLVENNVFRDTKVAVTAGRDSDVDGYAVLRGNDNRWSRR